MSKTKITGILLLIVAVLKVSVDALDGGEFALAAHFDALITALGGVGLVFLRNGLQKVQDAVGPKK